MDAVLRRGAGARTGNELGSRRSNIATGTTIENASCGLRQVAIMVALLSFVFTACAALVYFSKYQAVMEKLGKCEQDLFEQIIQLDRFSRQAKRAESQLKQTNEKFKVYESETEDARLMLSTVKEQLTIGKHQREQLEQQLSESRRLADEALSNLSSLKVELARAEDDIKYLKLKLSDQAIRCNAGAADREETNTSSLYPPGFHWPASTMQRRLPRRLAIIIPHALHQENRLSEFYSWTHSDKNIPACNSKLPYTHYRDLWIYTNKLYGGSAQSDSLKMAEYKENMKKVSMYSCYGSINFISANLTEEQDPYPYPAGKTRDNGVIADLFFRIFEMNEFRNNYDYAFVMETDVRPLRPYWLDNIYEHAEFAMEDFWIKGSVFRGTATPKEYCMGILWGCGDHFNGNSMYRLGDPVFDSFLRFARNTRVDPGKSVGINHDAQLVRVLRDPAVWRFFQRYAHKFVYTEFIQHRPPLIVDEVRRVFNNTFVVHQASILPEEVQDGEADEIYLDRLSIVLQPS